MRALSQKQKKESSSLPAKKTASEIARSLHLPEQTVDEFLQSMQATPMADNSLKAAGLARNYFIANDEEK